MARRAKNFQNRGSQAIRLAKSWSDEFVAALGAWRENIERPRSLAMRRRSGRVIAICVGSLFIGATIALLCLLPLTHPVSRE
jgi:hypothetical protein